MRRGVSPRGAVSRWPPSATSPKHREGHWTPRDPSADSIPVLILIGPRRISDETEAQIRTPFNWGRGGVSLDP